MATQGATVVPEVRENFRGAPGLNGILRVYPESGQSVIVLCNLDPPSASRIEDWLLVRTPLKSWQQEAKRRKGDK